MFNQARPQFGAPSTGFNFGNTATTQSGFGASSTFGRPVFGASASTGFSGFGSNTNTASTSLFGAQTQASTGGLFGQPAQQNTTAGFGATNTGFGGGGGGLFGSQPNTSTATNLFGSNNQTGFNNQNKAPFSFGNSAATTSAGGGGLFGANNAGTLFSTNPGGFGAGGAAPTGTPIKFNAVTDTDTMNRSGVPTTIQTKFEVITCMKEYESKSLEELRVEDYIAGRKGPGQAPVLGYVDQSQQPAQSTGGLFGAQSSSGTGLFGTKPAGNTSLFGTNTSTGFGGNTTGGGLFNTSTATGFGQPNNPAASTSFSFGQPNKTTGSFGFGTTTTTASLFGQPQSQASTGFGGFGTNTGGGLFSQNKPAFNTATSSGGLFGQQKPATGGFGTGTGFGTTGFGGTLSSGTSLFGTNTNTNSTGLFGTQNKNTTFAPLGTGNTTTGLFGQPQKPAGGLNFGGTTGFGTGTTGLNFTSNTGTGLFGTTNNTFNTGNTGTGFGSTFNTGLGMPQLQQNNAFNTAGNINGNISNLIKALTHNPFGNSSLLKNGLAPTGKADELITSPTSSTSDQDKLNNSSLKPTYVLPNSNNNNKLRPVPLNKANGYNNKVNSLHGKQQLFLGLDDSTDSGLEDAFKPKSYPSVKKLNLKVFKNQTMNMSLTSPITTPSHQSVPPSHDNSPTPDVIKSKMNLKRFNVSDKNLDDTIADLNVANRQSNNSHNTSINKQVEPDTDEANKENHNISIFETSSIDDIQNTSNLTTFVQNAAAIKLTKKGYYTLPALDDLGDLVEDMRCVVENFTVGRLGYGNVCFLGCTDIYGLDLDQTVTILRKEVEVYPEDLHKPPQNEGLNKPSIITLDCVWPVDKTNREVIKAPERLENMQWSDYLERQCIKMDAQFVEYRPETGSWVFKVKHFSKYGLQDDDEEVVVTPPQAAGTAELPSIVPSSGIQMIPIKPLHVVDSTTPSQFTDISSYPPSESLPVTGALSMTGGLFSMKPSGGPPTSALTLSSPMAPSVSSVTAIVPPHRSMHTYLDGTGLDSQPVEDLSYQSIAAEPEETAAMSMMSPSCERLAVSTRAPARAVQLMKSQMFVDEEEEDAHSAYVPRVRQREESPSFRISGPKKLMLSTDLSSNMTSASLSVAPEERLGVKPRLVLQPQMMEEEVSHRIEPDFNSQDYSCGLQDARSEYLTLPSGKNVDNESGQSNPLHTKKIIPLEQSHLMGIDRCISDIAAFKGRSFRVGWGPGMTLVHGGPSLGENKISEIDVEQDAAEDRPPPSFLFAGQDSQPVAKSKVLASSVRNLTIERLSLNEDLKPRLIEETSNFDSLTESSLTHILNHSELVQDDMSDFTEAPCPLFKPACNVDLLHNLAAVADQMEHFEGDRRISTILNLCVALWGNIPFYSPEEDGDTEYSVAMARVEALSRWLECVVAGIVEEEVDCMKASDDPNSYLTAVFAHLSARQISEACMLAQDKGDNHLALLLSQICFGQDAPRQFMSQQLDNWVEAGSDATLDDMRLVIYSLLSAKPTHKTSHKLINTCVGLDWRRAFALHLWFICSSNSTINEVLQAYEEAAGFYQGFEKYCEQPLPSYVSDGLHSAPVDNHDICYNLLKLFTDPTFRLDQLLEVSTITPDAVDVTTSWVLWQVLQSLGYHHLSDVQSCNLHTNMSAVLESSGQWHWAVFPLLAIPSEERRKSEVKSLLGRHVRISSEEENDLQYKKREEFIINDLHIPIKWLHELKAVKARCLGQIDEEAWYLLKSGDYNRAHSLIIDTIAPNAIINEDHEYLLTYLDELKHEDIHDKIVEWVVGGSVYVNYLEVCALIDEMKKSQMPTAAKVEKLRPRLLALCSHLNNLKCPTSRHKLCVSEMSRVVVGVLRAVLGEEVESGTDQAGAIQVLAQQISSLPLTHDYALDELNLVFNMYLTQLTRDNS